MDIDTYVLMIDAAFLGAIIGMLVVIYTNWGRLRAIWGNLIARYVRFKGWLRRLKEKLPSIVDSCFYLGALLVLLSIWIGDNRLLGSGLWFCVMAIFMYMGRKDDDNSKASPRTKT